MSAPKEGMGGSATAGVAAGALVLPGDVVLVPVAELDADVRRRLTWQAGDVAITRPRLRTPSRLLDAASASLVREFAVPSTIVEAVLRHSRTHGSDPEATLDAAYPVLERLVQERFLVAAGERLAAPIEASSAARERIAGFAVVRCVQVLEDNEVYQVRAGGALAGARPPWERAARPVAAALKIERPREPASPAASAASAGSPAGAAGVRLRREAAILDHLGRRVAAAARAPRLLASGRWGERHFLAQEWCSGVDVASAAGELRGRGGAAGRREILGLCREIAAAYAWLHRQDVLHCDVHPRNVLVDGEGRVRLIDFGLARWSGLPPSLAPVGRGGVAFYSTPEQAAAALAETSAPPMTAAAEQYSVAVLLYLLVAGSHYLDFSLEREALLRQIAASPPLSFTARGLPAWPELEAVLGRALAKAPADRYPSLDGLLAALAELHAAGGEPAVGAPGADEANPIEVPAVGSVSVSLGRGGSLAEVSSAVLAAVRPGGRLWEEGVREPPAASVQFGAAGIALGLYRMAMARQDPDLLAWSDLWARRAGSYVRGSAGSAEAFSVKQGVEEGNGPMNGTGYDPAFYSLRLDITPATVGRASLFHGEPGLRCTEALIAAARDDRGEARRAADAFVAAASQPCPNPDLTLGRSGLLLGAALLHDALAALGDVDSPAASSERATEWRLLALGDDLLAGLWSEIGEQPPLGATEEDGEAGRGGGDDENAGPGRWLNLGIAHGWAGYLYATLRWCQASGRPLPAGVTSRLDELGDAAESWGRGARWRWHGRDTGGEHRRPSRGAASAMAGWCNGSAGMVHLWTLAHRQLGDPRYGHLARAAAWHAWEADDRGENLCCGLAGRAYALLNLYRHGGDAEWLERARRLAGHAAADSLAARGADLARGADIPHAAARLIPDAAARPIPAEVYSLYRGALGVGLLAVDLEVTEGAAMPLFGDEGWVSR